MTHAIARFCTLLTVAATVAGCGMADTTATAEEAHARARADWKLTLEDGKPLPLERMDIYLVEDDTDPEIFELYGDDVALVGVFPSALHVGYEEEFSRLIGKTIALEAEGGDPREPKSAYVTVGGSRLDVVGGGLRVEKVTGTWDGSDGDKTLWGTVELEVEDDEGSRTLRGTFAVQVVTWG